MNIFKYAPCDFVCRSQPSSQSKFDEELGLKWQAKMKEKLFFYTLDEVKTKVVNGPFPFILQLNEKRLTQKRVMHHITDVVMPFNEEIFHFGKIPTCEKLFLLTNVSDPQHESHVHEIILNKSPFERNHSLLVPHVRKKLPQIMTYEALQLAVEVLLLSADSNLRIAYNSLGALASINHLHWHIYNLDFPLTIEKANTEVLAGACSTLSSYPSSGFCFFASAMNPLVKDVMPLLEFFQRQKVAHNIFLTRGLPHSKPLDDPEERKYEDIRICVFPRKTHLGKKDESSFCIGVCELVGHVIVKTTEDFELLKNDGVLSDALRNETYPIFSEIIDQVKNIYQDRCSS